jgi:hypothetical protein
MENSSTSQILDPTKIKEANESLEKNLQGLMKEGSNEFKRLRTKLNITYTIIVSLSIIMFLLGIVLLLVPIIAAFNGDIDNLKSIISAGFGIADLTALFLYGPIEKIHKNMGDMSQIVLSINSYRSQVALRLLEMDVEKDRPSIGIAAEKIAQAAESSIKSIENYFESRKDSQ